MEEGSKLSVLHLVAHFERERAIGPRDEWSSGTPSAFHQALIIKPPWQEPPWLPRKHQPPADHVIPTPPAAAGDGEEGMRSLLPLPRAPSPPPPPPPPPLRAPSPPPRKQTQQPPQELEAAPGRSEAQSPGQTLLQRQGAGQRVSRRYLHSFPNQIPDLSWRTQEETAQGGRNSDNGENAEQDPEEKKIATELLETEKAYVKRLYLLDQVFCAELLAEARSMKSFPEDVVKLVFSNISSIYQFHRQFFLPELQRRMDDWAYNPRIGDVIQKLAPFLKMYGEYVKNFDKAMELISTWTEKCQSFQDIITDIQKREASANLSLQHHMLEPVQRIPRYELLLKDYVKKLPPESPDRADAEKALGMIFSAAKHSNAAIAELERIHKLWQVYEKLGIAEDDFVDPSNELIKEGPIQKISFRFNTTKERYLFLFNNMLLYCVPKVIQVGSEFQVRIKIDVDGMKAKELKDTEFPYVFLISGKQRTLELQARSSEEAESWVQACRAAVQQNEKRTESFKAATQGSDAAVPELWAQSEELGKRAPLWVRDNLVTLCKRCMEPFHPITRRRHHCRACGYVVCGKCSDYRAKLKYDRNRLNRVCIDCYTFLTGCVVSKERDDKKKGILERDASEVSDRSLMCGFLQLLDKSGKGGPRSWCVVPKDDPYVLYMFAAPQDAKAHTSIPLLGYQVNELLPHDSRHLFQLLQSTQVHTFMAESEELRRCWARTIGQAANGENPSPEDELNQPWLRKENPVTEPVCDNSGPPP
ncbi:FYVE, RhoGEF and PH domain-containing protein 2 [Rhinatrema bivittatum]|uniref:FYVE, RhoGEF and PH domain-containing protein 2 n=1 Tax=Rhinatrema bivittatum TaxID=194408 RepID=UPI00112E9D0C|nr:FYVE, RhoGEF and PH domain-containing protein 2 [Rhinatrema bivittatum]